MRFNVACFLFLMLIISGCEPSTANDQTILAASIPSSSSISTPSTLKPANNSIYQMSDQQLEQLKPVVKKLFTKYLESRTKPSVPEDKRIKDFIVHDKIQIFKNFENVYFIVPYDTLAASKKFVAAGGGEWSEDGWYKNRELHVVIEKNGEEYRIKGVSSGP